MKVSIKMFSHFKEHLPQESKGDYVIIEVRAGIDLAEILQKFNISPKLPKVITVNDEFQEQNYMVQQGDFIKIFPVAQGG